MYNSPIKKLVILGGGTAGWMAASALAKFFSKKPIDIILVESEQLGTVGVGEATVPILQQFNRFLGIDESEFIRATNGSFKLGIEFCDWLNPGSCYFHGFGDFGEPFMGVSAHHYWLRLRAQGDETSLFDYSFSAQAAWQRRFALPPDDSKLASIAAFDYAYHFDAAAYATQLRAYAEAGGVSRIEGRVSEVRLCPKAGHIEALILEDGNRVAGDFFIDCSGFGSRLLGEALQVDYLDWSHWLPCDRALAVACEPKEELTPFTRATARPAGWQWRIPLQHRIGNGYVYASGFTSDEEAGQTLLSNLESEPLTDPKALKFLTGRRRYFWHKNCLALGLASGFLEPLESTSIQLIQTGLMRFLEYFPATGSKAAVIDEYNRVTANEYERLRDFLILHYCTSRRDDSEFWRYMRNMTLPDTLAHKLAVFKASGQVPLYAEESYREPSWISILVGQEIVPNSYSARADMTADTETVRRLLDQRRRDISAVVERMPHHEQFLASQ